MPLARIFALVVWFSAFNSLGQTKEIDSLFRYSQYQQLDSILFQSNNLEEIDLKLAQAKYYNTFKQLEDSFDLLFDIDTSSISVNQKAYYFHSLAKAYDLNGNFDAAAVHYKRAQTYYKKIKEDVKSNSINLDLYYIMYDPDIYSDEVDYLKDFKQQARKLEDPLQLVSLELELAFDCEANEDSTSHYLTHIDKAYDYLKQDPDPYTLSVIHSFHAFYYTDVIVLKDSAEVYYNKALEINKALGLSHKVALSYFNLGDINRLSGDYNKAIFWTKKANAYRNFNYDFELTAYINEQLADDYRQLGQFDSAYYFLNQSLQFRDSLNYQKQNINLTRFEAEKKERENLILEKKNQKNQSLVVGSLGAVALLFFLSISVYINAKRKRLLVEKEKALQIRRIENELKKQQLKALDALVMGQEKERMRIASDLHDNIGSNFVAMTAYFEQLKKELKTIPESSSIFNRTQQLLDDTYQDIRSLAHLKHSGQMKNRDLIPALEKLTKNVSSFSKIEVEFNSFIEHELELDDHLELNIFRIVQEAMANIVKHSKARTASVSVTYVESLFNIIIEDDGKGFDLDQIKTKSSLGLEGIQQRVDLLNGDFKIDTKKGRGTILIIDIPV